MSRLELRGLRSRLAGPFDLTLPAGGVLAVTGPSGAGKSVFLRMVADPDPSKGDVLLDGVFRRDFTGPAWRARVVNAAAEPGWWCRRSPAALAERLGLRPGILDQPVRLCSTGERRRLALLRALEANPAVLLLDEPTAALDPAATAAVESLLRERCGTGMALLLVTHDAAQAGHLGGQAMRLEVGRLHPA